jgi:O-antigen ligase
VNEYFSTLSGPNYEWSKLQRAGLLFAGLLGLCLIALTCVHALSLGFIAFLGVGCFALFVFGLNFNAVVLLLCFSFYIEFFFLSLSVAEWVSCFVLVSFFLTHKFSKIKFKNDIISVYFIYLISIIPSYFMMSWRPASGLFLFRYVGFLSLLALLPVAFPSFEKMKWFFYFFVLCAVLNVFTMIRDGGLSGARVFGQAGIMFVDLVGIAIALSFVHIIFKRKHTGLMIVLLAVLLLGAFMTQTRNSWIAIILTLVYCSYQFIKGTGRLGYASSLAKFRIMKFVLGLSCIILVAVLVSPNTMDRFTQKKKAEADNERYAIEHVDSFTSRVFIWHTALNAFKAHPIFGVGNYNFQFVSEDYNALPLYVYGLFVYGRRPHLVIMELLCETGVVGFLGYLFFIIFTWKKAARIMRQQSSESEFYYTLSIVGCLFYITVSMLMTDAWLWGQLQMLHACVLAGIVIIENHQKQRAKDAGLVV